MNKLGQGVSELHVQGKWAHLILQWPDLADYLRKNSGVKDYRLTTTACHAGPPRRNTAKEEARENMRFLGDHGSLELSTRAHANDVIFFEHQTVAVNIDLALADDQARRGHALHLPGFLSKRAVKTEISEKGKFGVKPRSGTKTYSLVDLVPRHAGELMAAAALTGQGQCATPNDCAS
jgi:hypothetical protein